MARRSPTVPRRILSLLERGLPPALLADSELRRRALLIAGTVWAVVVACVASFPVLFAVTSGPGRLVSLGANACVIALALAGLALLRRSATPRVAGHWVAGLMFAGIACGVIINGGFASPYWILLAVVPFMASQMAGRGAGFSWTIVDVAFITAIFALLVGGGGGFFFATFLGLLVAIAIATSTALTPATSAAILVFASRFFFRRSRFFFGNGLGSRFLFHRLRFIAPSAIRRRRQIRAVRFEQ